MSADLKNIVKCTACGASIIWCDTTSGARMPVDAEPVPNGNVKLFPTIDRKWLAIVLGTVGQAHGDHRDRYVSHFATCPHASKFRTRPKGRTP